MLIRKEYRCSMPSRAAGSWQVPTFRQHLGSKDVTTFITQFLTPLEQEITSSTPSDIIEKIRVLSWSAVEVTEAFCHRAALAHQLVSNE
jgi:hypothetical protein